MNFKTFFFTLLFPLALLQADPIVFFNPPPDWECVFPSNLSPCIQVGFLGKGSTQFRPSINLAIEMIDIGLKEYVKAVKEIHLAQTGTTWRDLGKFKTQSGMGRLTEIGTTSPLGPVKMLQMIIVAGKTAYIMTGAAISKDFLRFQEQFLKAFQSLRVADDLFTPLSSEKKAQFESFFAELAPLIADEAERNAKWMDLQKLVSEESSEMGNYWQILVLKSGREKIYR